MKMNNRKMTAMKQETKGELHQAVMLFINRCLYEKGHITEEMYHKAKDEFLRLG